MFVVRRLTEIFDHIKQHPTFSVDDDKSIGFEFDDPLYIFINNTFITTTTLPIANLKCEWESCFNIRMHRQNWR